MSLRDPRDLHQCVLCGTYRHCHDDKDHKFTESLSDHLACQLCGFEMDQTGPGYWKCRSCGWNRPRLSA